MWPSTASSVIGFMATVGRALIGQAFDGKAIPMVVGFFTVSLVRFAFVLTGEKGRLFHTRHKPL